MSTMGAVHGWSKLLDDPFFQHIKITLDIDDAKRLLAVIGENLYLVVTSFNSKDPSLSIPGDNIHKEVIGAQAERAKEQLRKFLENPEELEQFSSEKSGWFYRFFSEQNFQSYVFRLLDFLSAHARRLLPDMRQIPSFEDREKATARDNTEEFEDEIKKVEDARKSAEAAKDAAKEAKDTADSIMPNMLTTLGVFIAIVIAVVGCYLSVLLTHHAKDAKTINMAMILLMGHILLNIIFLLLYLISKMSAHSLACHCLTGDKMDCQECDPELREQCRLRHKLWLRYPYVVAMNGIFIVAYCVLGLWYLMDRYFGRKIDQALKNNWICAATVVVFVAVFIIAVGVFVFQFFLRSPRRKMEKVQKKEQKAQEKKEKAKEKERCVENERKNVRELRNKLGKQEEQIILLEEKVDALTKRLNQYTQKKDSTPVK